MRMELQAIEWSGRTYGVQGETGSGLFPDRCREPVKLRARPKATVPVLNPARSTE